MEQRKNAGYIITDSITIKDTEFVFGEQPDKGMYVTWQCKNGTDYTIGGITPKTAMRRSKTSASGLPRKLIICPLLRRYHLYRNQPKIKKWSDNAMDMKLRIMTPEEQKYAFFQSQQLMMQCGGIGYLRGDFASSGKEFYSTWFDHNQSRKTDEFKAEFDDVINALRSDEQYGGILKDRNAMNFYCANQPGSRMESRYNGDSFGFRADTETYAYLIRCNPQKGDYNFYVFPYIAKCLDRNIEQASNGIRFIDSHYHELFRIPDGESIIVTYENGETNTRSCRYIDETHVEVGNNLYHICEFAERMEQNGYTYAPEKLPSPKLCYTTLPSTGELIVLKYGECGSFKTDYSTPDRDKNREIADFQNNKLGVSKAQEAAMLAGSMFGWNASAADPKNYDDKGKPIKPAKKKDYER